MRIESTMKIQKTKGDVAINNSFYNNPLVRINFSPISNHRIPLSYSKLYVERLERIIKNIEIEEIRVKLNFNDRGHFELIEKLRYVNAKKLDLNNDRMEGCPLYPSEKIDFSFIRDATERIESVEIYSVCNALSFEEISSLSEVVRSSAAGAKLVFWITEELAIEVFDRWLGIEFFSLLSGNDPIIRTNGAIEVYRDQWESNAELRKKCILDGLFETSMQYYCDASLRQFRLGFVRHSAQSKQDTLNDLIRI
ncbi:hypothetical protein PFISCL1PPCAC_28527 [Pristionchus fissidentatus]|uniref:Uncharacterized protein n=1 Tax=Pristionchus fissidentatus TaxID=1538716 RepID=A0AAV5X2I9_9BILA|nr:hypothetical protein PFISCL1PPCAC_19167 [Pristionchus fissidentatus]GMT37230.1 hypothetical protein PFISCL1PPCAC_28527 [Pristionchus fissidentatus]